MTLHRRTLFTALSTLGTLLTSGAALSAPGELDPFFNGGPGFAAVLAPAGMTEPVAATVCLDGSLRVVVSASLKSAGANQWQGQLLRTSASGVPDATLAAGYWRALGTVAALPQMPALRCEQGRYVTATVAGSSAPYQVRLDLVPAAGGAGSSTLLNSGLHALQPRIALASAQTYGHWWVGPAVQSPWAHPTYGTSALHHWQEQGGTLLNNTALNAQSFGGMSAQYTDVELAPNGDVFAIGRFQLNGNYNAYVERFNASGQQYGSFLTTMVQSAEHDYGQRIALAGNAARIYAGTTTISTGVPLQTGIRIVRLLSSGQPDPGCGDNGAWTLSNAELGDVLEDAQGRVLVVGRHNGVAAIIRLLANGTPDTGFGPGGERVFGFGSLGARFDSLTTDLNGRYVVAGTRFAAERGGQSIPAAVIVARILP